VVHAHIGLDSEVLQKIMENSSYCPWAHSDGHCYPCIRCIVCILVSSLKYRNFSFFAVLLNWFVVSYVFCVIQTSANVEVISAVWKHRSEIHLLGWYLGVILLHICGIFPETALHLVFFITRWCATSHDRIR